MDRDRVLEQIRKCMALAGNNPNEKEVEVAMATARRLMDKYSIEEAELNVKADDTENARNVNEIDGVHRKGRIEIMDLHVGEACATLCDCKMLNVRLGDSSCVRFIGFPRDIAIAKALFEQLRIIMRTMARTRYGKRWGNEHASYSLGFAVQLRHRAMKLQDASKQAVQTGAIVLAKGGAIELYYQKAYKQLPPSKQRGLSRFNSEAYANGIVDGDNVDLGTKSITGGAS